MPAIALGRLELELLFIRLQFDNISFTLIKEIFIGNYTSTNNRSRTETFAFYLYQISSPSAAIVYFFIFISMQPGAYRLLKKIFCPGKFYDRRI